MSVLVVVTAMQVGAVLVQIARYPRDLGDIARGDAEKLDNRLLRRAESPGHSF